MSHYYYLIIPAWNIAAYAGNHMDEGRFMEDFEDYEKVLAVLHDDTEDPTIYEIDEKLLTELTVGHITTLYNLAMKWERHRGSLSCGPTLLSLELARMADEHGIRWNIVPEEERKESWTIIGE